MLEIWRQIKLNLISHLQDAQNLVRGLGLDKNAHRTAQDLVPGIGHAQDLVCGLGSAQDLVPSCTWICAFRLVYSKTLLGG